MNSMNFENERDKVQYMVSLIRESEKQGLAGGLELFTPFVVEEDCFDGYKLINFISSEESTDKGRGLPIHPFVNQYDKRYAISAPFTGDRFNVIDNDFISSIHTGDNYDVSYKLCIDFDNQIIRHLGSMLANGKHPQDAPLVKELLRKVLSYPEVDFSCWPYLIEEALKSKKHQKEGIAKCIAAFWHVRDISMSKRGYPNFYGLVGC